MVKMYLEQRDEEPNAVIATRAANAGMPSGLEDAVECR
jgi:hypothetical protein